MSNSSNVNEIRKTKIESMIVKSSTVFLKRIVDRRNNFDDDIVESAILELKNRKVIA